MKKEKEKNKDLNQLSVIELNKLSEESITLLNKVDSLVTILSDKSQITSTDDEIKQYKCDLYDSLVTLEKDINLLRDNLINFHTRSENYKLEDIIMKYNSLSKKIKDNDIKIDVNELVSNKIANKDLSKDQADQMLDQMVKELQKVQEENGNGKTLQIKIPKGGPIQGLLNLLITVVFDLLLIIGFSGLIKWCEYDTFLDLFLFVLYYSLVEGILKFIILTVFQKYLVKTFGLILYIPTIFALFVTCLYPFFVSITSIYLYIVVVILASLLRKFIANYLLEKSIGSAIKKLNKGKRK